MGFISFISYVLIGFVTAIITWLVLEFTKANRYKGR
jgi:hypothetical protein